MRRATPLGPGAVRAAYGYGLSASDLLGLSIQHCLPAPVLPLWGFLSSQSTFNGLLRKADDEADRCAADVDPLLVIEGAGTALSMAAAA